MGDDEITIVMTTHVVYDFAARRGALLPSVDAGVATP
jgi:hypothetical protein